MRYTFTKNLWGLLVIFVCGCSIFREPPQVEFEKPPTEVIDEYILFEGACEHYGLDEFECLQRFNKSFTTY